MSQDMEILADQISRAFRGESWHGPSVLRCWRVSRRNMPQLTQLPELTAFGRSSFTWAADTLWSFGGFVERVRSSRRKKSGLQCRRAVRRLGAKASKPWRN